MFIETEVCKNCEQSDEWVIDTIRGDYICSKCGCVSEDRLVDWSLEKRNFSTSVTDHNRGQLSNPYMTSLASTNIGSKRQKTSAIQKAHQKINKASTSIDDHLTQFFHVLDNFCTALQLERKVSEKAKEILHQYEKANNGSRRTLEFDSGALAALHLACGYHKTGRTLNSLYMDLKQAGFDVDEKQAQNTRSKIIKKIPGIDVQTKSTDVITNFCEQLQLPMLVVNVAKMIQTKSQPFVEGKTPSTIAAGSIILAGELLYYQVDRFSLLAVANCADSTLKKYCKEIKTKVPLLIEPAVLEQTIKEHGVTK
jgi:transcription initiation factor TFIIIB Brf1 subunit/transcription initiation factor TFIIB